jgi:hypothetical protein
MRIVELNAALFLKMFPSWQYSSRRHSQTEGPDGGICSRRMKTVPIFSPRTCLALCLKNMRMFLLAMAVMT